MDDIKWTAEQQKIIDSGSGSMLVSASAGSGKTTVMLARVMRLIDGGYSIRRMLISTFTVAAAADMRNKLSALLTAKYEKTKDKRYLEELDSLPTADIGTMHSWCQKLIRKYFYVTGDDPAFDIVDSSEGHIWKRLAITRAIEEAENDPESGYIELANVYNKRRSDRNIREILEKITSFAQSQADADEWLDNAANGYTDTAELTAFLSGEGNRAYDKICRGVNDFRADAAAYSLEDKAEKYALEVQARADYVKRGGDYSVLGSWQRSSGITQISDVYADLRKQVEDYASFMESFRNAKNDIAAASARTLIKMAKRAIELYSAMKADKGRLDFNDLERKAKTILLSEEGANVRNSYTHVFIDEYQDINPLQESIIDLVGNNNLFFVGDIKQSIYAFRDCTPEAFADKKRKLSENDSLVELNKNYRSTGGILSFCNRLFSRIMTEDFGGVDYDRSARFPIDGTESDDSVEIYSYRYEKKDGSKEDFSEVYSVKNHAQPERASTSGNEADAVTDKIIGLLRNSKYTYSDIVVLVRSRTEGVNRLVTNLRAVGVPVSVSSKLKVSKGRCNGYLLGWLKIIDNFMNDISLAAVMRSPCVGFTDGELAKIRAAHHREKYFYDCVLGESKNPKVSRFLATVTRYTELSKTVTAGELAGTITSEQKLFATALSEKQGIAKADGLGRLMESVTNFNGTLSEYLQMLGDTEPEIDIPSQPGSVRIMTMHSSKGLEFPVVFTYGLSRTFKTDKSAPYLTDGKFGLGLEARIAETGEVALSYPLMAARLRRTASQLEEEMRILYVALTRAREKLIIFLPDNAKEKDPEDATSFVDWIYPTAVSHGIRQPEEREQIEYKRMERGKVTEERIAEVLEVIQPHTESIKTAEIKKSVTDLLSEEYEENAAPVLIKDYDGKDGLDKQSAMKRGTAYHSVLENMDFARPFDEQLGSLAELADFELVDTDKLRAAHACLREETANGEVYREQQFIFASDKTTNGESDGMLLQGVIDLLILRGKEGEIIDYKTGALTAERKEKYNRQLDIYAAAVEKVLGISITKKRIYLIENCRFMD